MQRTLRRVRMQRTVRRVRMQRTDGLGQPRVGQAGHDADVHQAVGHGMPQELDQQHLGQPVHHRAVPAGAAPTGGQT